MKKLITTIAATMMTTASIAMFSPLNSIATEEATIQHEQYKSAEEQYEIFINSDFATPEKIAQYEEMMREHEMIANGESYIMPRATNVRLGVPFRSQIKTYYCGPATVQQVRGYYYGTSQLPSQDTIAAALGTTTDGTDVQPIVNYFNSNFSKTYASQWYFSSASNLFNYVVQDASQNKPTVAFIQNTNTTNWRYSVDAHFLCFEGYVDDTSTGTHNIYVVDPFLNGHNIAGGKYSVSQNNAYSVTTALIT